MVCRLCPHNCNADRSQSFGVCRAGQLPRVAKSQLHLWEEPPISGINGSGTVFFSGCNLRCVYCQNYKISQGCLGTEMSVEQLAALFLNLMAQKAHNINLVTPTHFIPQIKEALTLSKAMGLNIPIVYNSSAYENVEALRLLDGMVDIYLPDIKYYGGAYAEAYSSAKDYFPTAVKAIEEMYRQTGENVFGEDGLLKRGMIIRHLILPGLRKDSFKIIDWIRYGFSAEATVSLLAQYFPEYKAKGIKALNRRITGFEYDSVVQHFFDIGLKNGYIQERTSAVSDYVPDF